MEPNTLSSVLNTIAQCAAALAALIGFFGLWRLERVHEQIMVTDRSIKAREKELTELNSPSLGSPFFRTDSRGPPYIEQRSRLERRLKVAREHSESLRTDQRRLMTVLVCFLLGTLAFLAVAIVCLAFTEELCTWVWPMRVFIVVAGLWLGGAPAYIVLHAAGHGKAMQQHWAHLRYHIRRPWRRIRTWRGRALIVDQLRGQWSRLHRGEGALIREQVQRLERVIKRAETRRLQSQWRRQRRKSPP